MTISEFELQDAIVAPDQSASAALPISTRRGVIEALELRHTGGSFQSLDAVEVSTHPEHWWGVARPIPLEPYAQQVRVVVRLTVADADVEVRARVGMQVSSVQTASSGATSVVECVVTLPVMREARVEVLSVEIRSTIGDTLATGVLVTGQWGGGLTLDTTPNNLGGSSSIYAGPAHTYLTPDTDSGNWSGDTDTYDLMPGLYLGYIRPSGAGSHGYVWPEDTLGAATNPWGSVLYDAAELGRATIHGIAWSLEGRTGDPLPNESAFAVRAYMRATDVLAMQAVAAQAYDARPWVWTPSMRDEDGRASGCTVGDDVQCLWTYRPDAQAIEIAALVGSSSGGEVNGRKLQIVLYDEDGTELDDATVATVDIPIAPRRTGPSEPGTLWSFSAFGSWGGADLLYAGPATPDWQRLHMVRATVNLADLAVTQRDKPYVLRVRVVSGTGSGRLRMHGLTIWERTRSEDSP